MATRDLTVARVRELLDYDPSSGAMTWRVRRGSADAGTRAGAVGFKGYRFIGIDGEKHREHLVVWLWCTGALPIGQIDHADGNRANNRIRNLREASNAENAQNRTRRSDNSSGFVGVTWHAKLGKWMAQIKADGKNRNLGYFNTAELAHAAYLEAKERLHRFQPRPR